MLKKIYVIIIFIIIFIVIKLLPNEKKAFINDINRLKKAVEKEDKAMVLNYISREYLDQNSLDYENLTSIITEFFNIADSINISLSGLKVKIDSIVNHKTFASCSLGLRVIAKYENEKVLVFGGVIHPASVKGYFIKQKDYYKIYYAEY